MSSLTTFKRIIVFAISVLLLTTMTSTFAPQSIGGSQTYLADIFCTPSARNLHCEGELDSLKYGDSCINPPMECLQVKNESSRTVTPLYGATYYSRPNPLWQLQGFFVTDSIKWSVVRLNLFNSFLTISLLFMGWLLTQKRSGSPALIEVVGTIFLIPALFFQLGGIYPASLGLTSFVVFLAVLRNIEMNLSRSFFTLDNLKLLGVGSLCVFLLAHSRVDYWLFGTAVSVYALLHFGYQYRRTLIMMGKSALPLLSIFLTQFLLSRPSGATNTQTFNLAIQGSLELSEAPETEALRALGIEQTGSLFQRVWYAITAPVYYIRDYFGITEISLSWKFQAVLLMFLLPVLLYLAARAIFGTRHLNFSTNVAILLLVGALIMPAYVQTGHVRLRYVAPLLLGALLLLRLDRAVKFQFDTYFTPIFLIAIWMTPSIVGIIQIVQEDTLLEILGVNGELLIALIILLQGVLVLALGKSLNHENQPRIKRVVSVGSR